MQLDEYFLKKYFDVKSLGWGTWGFTFSHTNLRNPSKSVSRFQHVLYIENEEAWQMYSRERVSRKLHFLFSRTRRNYLRRAIWFVDFFLYKSEKAAANCSPFALIVLSALSREENKEAFESFFIYTYYFIHTTNMISVLFFLSAIYCHSYILHSNSSIEQTWLNPRLLLQP